jgi:hypothetical protein
MCENTVNKALRLMGYDTKDEICGHGFQAMACSALMESGLWSKDAVERQIGHQGAIAFEPLTSIKRNISMPESDDAVVVRLSGCMQKGFIAPYIYSK